jgi:hypothetical protein
MDRVILEKLPVPQLVKQFPAFYGTQRSITMLTTALVPVLNQINLVYILLSHFFKIHYNIILSSMLNKSAPSLHVSQPKSCMHFTCLCPLHLSWFYLPRHCFMSSTNHAACNTIVSSSTLPKGPLVPRLQREVPTTVQMTAVRTSSLAYAVSCVSNRWTDFVFIVKQSKKSSHSEWDRACSVHVGVAKAVGSAICTLKYHQQPTSQ